MQDIETNNYDKPNACEESVDSKSNSAEKGEKFKTKIKNFFTYNIEGARLRAWELDLIRGIILLGVTFDHVCRFSYYWNLIQFKTAFGKALESGIVAFMESSFCEYAYPIVLWLLCFMSGISCQFARSSVTRLIKFWAVCAAFMGGYLMLHFIIPDIISGYVIFNIIAVLTVSVTFWYALEKLKLPDIYRLILGALIVVAGITLFFVHKLSEEGIYLENDFFALLIYNKHGYRVSPNNFEPLIPHIGFFILGGVFGRHVYRDKTTKLKRQTPPKWLSPLMLLGKHSLAAYLLMPVLCIPVIWLIVNFIGLFV